MKIVYILLAICLTNCSAQTKDNKLEGELVKIKNQAFCDCYYEATKNESVKYKDGSNYVQIINLNEEYIFGNENYRKMIDNWVKKEYKSYDSNNNLYLMKCLDFYNSKELKKFIDSVRQQEIILNDKFKKNKR
ncbi:hypothetical protein [Flavobacterium restrictum]|uniref:Uncharacterized protein n=1 Tax=Flavobacterium restrictum TaxID=2594428 RepID=A0A553DRL0_9FLAO|nr:hypothetical protein [Flavobacterium restrictum]TRX35409.1 hypothetical protein FNW21_15240 [Flavobacterium restrictum]